VVLSHPAGDERYQGQPEEQVQVRPEDLAVDPLGRVQHVVVVVPVDAEVDEAEHVRQEHRGQRAQRVPVRAVRDLQLEDQDRDQDGDDAVTERLETPLAHGLLLDDAGARFYGRISVIITSRGGCRGKRNPERP
jgi:hypothetical protein